MNSSDRNFSGKGTFARGIHPKEQKELACGKAIEVMPTPKLVRIALQQHTGAPCEVSVKMKQEVASGEVLGSAEAFISAPIHASVAGTVGKVSPVTLPNGRRVNCVPITAAGEQLEGDALYKDILGGEWDYAEVDKLDRDTIPKRVREAGIVGLGGAAFPTSVKLMYNEKKPVDILLLNGCECEPYLTADHRVMVEAPRAVVAGALVAAKGCGAKEIIIAVENNKPDAVDALRQAAEGTPVKVAQVTTKYPMGGEKQTVLAVTGRTIPTGGLPLDVGVVVINVGTSTAVARALLRGKNLTHRVVTVTGRGIREPKNLLVPVGISYQELVDFCGGLTEDAARLVAGGPMMGFTLGSLDVPVTKGTSGIVVLTHADVKKAEETHCIRCGRCVEVCPLNLIPTRIALAARNKDWDLAKRYHIMACMECGCCAYACPASLPLVQLMRMGKAQLPK
jgi:electron transport complex protein RnfC